MNLLTLNKPTNPKRTLLCLHHVGGNANVFRDLAKNVECDGVETFAISLPGRLPKTANLIVKDIHTIVEMAYDLIRENKEKLRLDTNPLVLFGHSLGGMIGYELTKKMDLIGTIKVERLILSAITNPKSLTEMNSKANNPHHKKTNGDLEEYLQSIGGLPAGVDPSMLKVMLPTMKGDYEAFETYNCLDFEPKTGKLVQCPITAFVATGDVSVSEAMMTPWEGYTLPGQFEIFHVGGSHFYITEDPHRRAMYGTLILTLSQTPILTRTITANRAMFGKLKTLC